ncbi:hypothetical protein LXL04_003975 [Taraxacum kok-saghyz]
MPTSMMQDLENIGVWWRGWRSGKPWRPTKKPRMRDGAVRRFLFVTSLTLAGVLLLFFLVATSDLYQENKVEIDVTTGVIFNISGSIDPIKLPKHNYLSKMVEKKNQLPPRNIDLYKTTIITAIPIFKPYTNSVTFFPTGASSTMAPSSPPAPSSVPAFFFSLGALFNHEIPFVQIVSGKLGLDVFSDVASSFAGDECVVAHDCNDYKISKVELLNFSMAHAIFIFNFFALGAKQIFPSMVSEQEEKTREQEGIQSQDLNKMKHKAKRSQKMAKSNIGRRVFAVKKEDDESANEAVVKVKPANPSTHVEYAILCSNARCLFAMNPNTLGGLDGNISIKYKRHMEIRSEQCFENRFEPAGRTGSTGNQEKGEDTVIVEENKEEKETPVTFKNSHAMVFG